MITETFASTWRFCANFCHLLRVFLCSASDGVGEKKVVTPVAAGRKVTHTDTHHSTLHVTVIIAVRICLSADSPGGVGSCEQDNDRGSPS